MFRKKLRSLVEEGSPAGRAFNFLVRALIIVSVISFSLETFPQLSQRWAGAFYALELAIVVFFSAEYLLRLYVAERRLGYACSFYGIVDLLAVLPFYLSGLDLRAVRILRLLRLFKFSIYGAAFNRLGRAFAHIRDELLLFSSAVAVLAYLAAAGIYYFEHSIQPETFGNVFSSLWWAITTLSTVGYGDVYPVTTGGRIFAGLVILMGLIVVAVPSGLVAIAMIETREEGDGDSSAASPGS